MILFELTAMVYIYIKVILTRFDRHN